MQLPSTLAIPDQAPVMTLSGVAFFPGALMPLHIFEPRYRAMLDDVLAGERLFAVVGLDDKLASDTGAFEPPFAIGSLGIIRASHLNDDGTSNLLLQGITRVRVIDIMHESPYRIARIEPLATFAGTTSPDRLAHQKSRLLRLMQEHQKLGGEVPPEMVSFLDSQEDHATVIDIAASFLCPDTTKQQKLLETLNTSRRYHLYLRYLSGENARLALDKQLRGKLKAGEADRN